LLEDGRKKCPNCGKVYDDEETAFCEVCGNRLERVSGENSITEANSVSETSEAVLPAVVATDSNVGANLPAVVSAPATDSKSRATVISAPVSGTVAVGQSKFDGGIFGFIGVKIVQMLLTGITLGIGYPWAVAYGEKWIADHTVIDGRRLTFTGTGGSLIGQYIKWWLLGIVTLGIYLLWMPINIRKWVAKHTVIEGGQTGESRFDGGLFALIGISLLNKIALIISVIAVVSVFGKLDIGAGFGEILINLVFLVGALGFLLPWTYCVYHKWMTTHTVINGKRLTFDGKATDLFKQYLKWFGLSIVTFGIYAFALGIKMKQWVVKNISGLGEYAATKIRGTTGSSAVKTSGTAVSSSVESKSETTGSSVVNESGNADVRKVSATDTKNIYGFIIMGLVVLVLLVLSVLYLKYIRNH
jgi:uncharacterized membrane protein YjgN (DUF898 family)